MSLSCECPTRKSLPSICSGLPKLLGKSNPLGRLRKSKPVETTRKFELGDLTLPYDSVRWTVSTNLVQGEPISREEIISLSGWITKDDLSAKLFAFGWLHIWNLNLVEPFPEHCPIVFDYEKRELG
jgi:hypothetical protein